MTAKGSFERVLEIYPRTVAKQILLPPYSRLRCSAEARSRVNVAGDGENPSLLGQGLGRKRNNNN